MSKIDDGGPAFPDSMRGNQPGMTLRDHFAALTMASILSGTQVSDESYWAEACRRVAIMSYGAADAAIAEKRRTEGNPPPT